LGSCSQMNFIARPPVFNQPAKFGSPAGWNLDLKLMEKTVVEARSTMR
jgi:hypothetical protein